MADKLEPLAVGATEAARLLGISRPTLYQLLNREDFPSFRVGNRVLISVHRRKKSPPHGGNRGAGRGGSGT